MTDTTMIETQGATYVAKWINHMLGTTRLEWRDLRDAVAGAYIAAGTTVLVGDVTEAHIGAMTPAIASDAARRVREYDGLYAADGRPLPTGRTCEVCGGVATMWASTGRTCDAHYDDLS